MRGIFFFNFASCKPLSGKLPFATLLFLVLNNSFFFFLFLYKDELTLDDCDDHDRDDECSRNNEAGVICTGEIQCEIPINITLLNEAKKRNTRRVSFEKGLLKFTKVCSSTLDKPMESGGGEQSNVSVSSFC